MKYEGATEELGSPEDEHSKEAEFKMREWIQHALIDKYYAFHVEDNDHIKIWVNEYAADFAKAFEAVLDDHPDLIHLYKEDSDIVVDLVEQKLQYIHTHH